MRLTRRYLLGTAMSLPAQTPKPKPPPDPAWIGRFVGTGVDGRPRTEIITAAEDFRFDGKLYFVAITKQEIRRLMAPR